MIGLVALVVLTVLWLAAALTLWEAVGALTYRPDGPFRSYLEVTIPVAAVALAVTAVVVGIRKGAAAGFATLLGVAFLFFGTCMVAGRFL